MLAMKAPQQRRIGAPPAWDGKPEASSNLSRLLAQT
jgi:hypothetical protein